MRAKGPTKQLLSIVYCLVAIGVVWCQGRSRSHRSLGHGWSGHISSISHLLGLVARVDRHGAAGAAPVCCCTTPVGGAGGRTGVHAAVLCGVLVFAVGIAGSGVVARATGAVVGTAGGECTGGAPGHSGVAGATLPGGVSSFFTASGCRLRMWSRARL